MANIAFIIIQPQKTHVMKVKVLQVNDKKNSGIIVNDILQSNGYEVMTADSLTEAVNCLSMYPDLIIVGMTNSSSNAPEFINLLRDIYFEDTPVIVISNDDYREIARSYFEMRVDDYLFEPQVWNQLMPVVRKLLSVAPQEHCYN